jgi:hypothetical protein
MYRHALERFRRFLALERGEAAPVNRLKPANIEQYHDGLPGWLISQLIHYQHLRQANWRPARLNQALLKFWSTHTRLFRWLFSRYAICGPNDIRRDQVFAYIDERLAAGTNPKSVNQDLRAFQVVGRSAQVVVLVAGIATVGKPGRRRLPPTTKGQVAGQTVCNDRAIAVGHDAGAAEHSRGMVAVGEVEVVVAARVEDAQGNGRAGEGEGGAPSRFARMIRFNGQVVKTKPAVFAIYGQANAQADNVSAGRERLAEGCPVGLVETLGLPERLLANGATAVGELQMNPTGRLSGLFPHVG